MRIMIKGGVWKNTEDEILKAAVMKYGKNQWARISSLLVRKSAKQCKARWYEWLDPSIKKTEWTREEDEKLLHLAKLMPTQWRTIAPIVGRTPAQCLDRYEKLLDAACAKDESYEPADDPRRLRPGEIDPNPESKPARPDPVDMDEDEKEMLSEARARLANTRGKKAKRKAREKQLEEARRLASLQKRRELKAAGIEIKHRKRKQKGIDYANEIPFEKRPPPGFYDTWKEEHVAQEDPSFVNVTLEELEGKRRVDIEAQLRKQDIARGKVYQRHDAPAAVLQANRLNDPEAVRKRVKLSLPAPQVSDRELEEIAKMGYAQDLVNGLDDGGAGGGGGGGGRRTPGGKGDAIMMEAENLARLRSIQTPLMGGENPTLHPSDFSGVTPKGREVHTPSHIVATPLRTPGGGGGAAAAAAAAGGSATPSSVVRMTPRGTPVRDELGINEDLDTVSAGGTGMGGSMMGMGEKLREAELRRNVRESLTGLPTPRNEYHIVIPDLPLKEEEQEAEMEEDMAEREIRLKAEKAAMAAAMMKKRSQVVQRGLLRPAAVSSFSSSLRRQLDAPPPPGGGGFSSSVSDIEQADRLVKAEMLAMFQYDAAMAAETEAAAPPHAAADGGGASAAAAAAAAPTGKTKKKSQAKLGAQPNGAAMDDQARAEALAAFRVDEFAEAELKEAEKLMAAEEEVLRAAWRHPSLTVEHFAEIEDGFIEDWMYFPSKRGFGLASVAINAEKREALQHEFDQIRGRMEVEAKRAMKMENRLKIVTGGYQKRAEVLRRQLDATVKQVETLHAELECFKCLHRHEILAAPRRIEGCQEDVDKMKESERSLQLRYENLSVEQENLRRMVEEHEVALRAAKEAAARAAEDMENRMAEMAEAEERIEREAAEAAARKKLEKEKEEEEEEEEKRRRERERETELQEKKEAAEEEVGQKEGTKETQGINGKSEESNGKKEEIGGKKEEINGKKEGGMDGEEAMIESEKEVEEERKAGEKGEENGGKEAVEKMEEMAVESCAKAGEREERGEEKAEAKKGEVPVKGMEAAGEREGEETGEEVEREKEEVEGEEMGESGRREVGDEGRKEEQAARERRGEREEETDMDRAREEEKVGGVAADRDAAGKGTENLAGKGTENLAGTDSRRNDTVDEQTEEATAMEVCEMEKRGGQLSSSTDSGMNDEGKEVADLVDRVRTDSEMKIDDRDVIMEEGSVREEEPSVKGHMGEEVRQQEVGRGEGGGGMRTSPLREERRSAEQHEDEKENGGSLRHAAAKEGSGDGGNDDDVAADEERSRSKMSTSTPSSSRSSSSSGSPSSSGSSSSSSSEEEEKGGTKDMSPA
ncbi:hypothetical protein CBR_g39826 [Chara braunii]|uniref:Uncharacterized protein n=1 Tax=Chara braunii TaxID=69332 RepID=A0A388LSM6_CHABU|nr:hypothetical protein CBR_g39826 [Chara braunii]|eukprot:GBG85259.1 hypothetical protein CBR_g39826 [Chara braunii]